MNDRRFGVGSRESGPEDGVGRRTHLLPPRRRRRTRRLPAAIPIAAAGLLCVVFFYVLWNVFDGRSATDPGDAPLIRADQAPARVPPEQPGGMTVPHQDRLVLQDLDQEDEPVVAEVLPLPEEPVERPVVDPIAQLIETALEEMPAASTETLAAASPPAAPDGVAAGAARPVAPAAGSEPGPASLPVARNASATGDLSDGMQALLDDGPGAAGSSATTLEPAAGGALTADGVGGPLKEALAATTPGAIPAEPEPPVAVTDLVRVQLASVRSELDARTEWQRLQATHADLLGPLSLVVERAELDGRGVWYRVQAVAPNQAAADQLCSALQSREANCLVVQR